MVDLVFTGSHPFTAKGTKGTCGSGNVFSFGASEADYPGIGQSFSVTTFSNGYPDIKWVFDSKVVYGTSAHPTYGYSADRKTLTYDDDLGHPSSTGPEHIHGTITCP
ncbi:MAG: hypothetical protein ACXVQX_03560 [Actinomycetota bacterium]